MTLMRQLIDWWRERERERGRHKWVQDGADPSLPGSWYYKCAKCGVYQESHFASWPCYVIKNEKE